MYLLQGSILAKKEKQSIIDIAKKHNIIPGLATILVGDNPASLIYVQSKIRACTEVGFYSEFIPLNNSCTTEELLTTIDRLNNSPNIHGILVQSPLPKHIDTITIINAITPHKDVDCFHPINLGRFFAGYSDFVPCTPKGIITLLDSIPNFSIEGKEALIIGRSNLVGKPIALLLSSKNATVTLAHSKTKNLEFHLKHADIIVAATGQAQFIKGDMIKEGVVILDVGISRIVDHSTNKTKIVGDVDFDSVKDKVLAISPVPGGVGPMTIVSLLSNTLRLALSQNDL